MKNVLNWLAAAFMCLPVALLAQTAVAKKGVLDLRQTDFAQSSPMPLGGEWEFFMSELLLPGAHGASDTAAKEFVEFPFTWNEINKSHKPGNGYATYRLKAVLRSPRTVAFEIPHFYSSYALRVNDSLVASNGKVGTTEASSIPQWLPQTIEYTAKDDTLDIVVHASNFHHAKGGVRENIIIGSPEDLNFKRDIAVTSNVALATCLLLLAIGFMFIYLFSKQDPAVIYLAALSITWGLRSCFSNLYIATHYFPEISWELAVKIEYITLYAMMIWAIFFLGAIFRQEINITFKYVFCVCNGVFIALTLVFNASVYTQFLPVYLSFAALLLIYVIYVLIRALVSERQGVWLMIVSIFLGAILFSYDLISYQILATFNPIIINLGYLVIFVLMSLTLLYQLGLMKKRSGKGNVLTYEDLYGTKSKS